MKNKANHSQIDFKQYRKLFPITEKYCFLNHAAISPWSSRVCNAAMELLEEFEHEGIAAYPRWMKRIQEARRLFATLVGAGDDEIAFMGNTSEGLSIVASGIRWKPGEKVLVSMPDFPTNIYPWLNLESRGVGVVEVRRREGGRLAVGDFQRALSPGARMVVVSSVDFLTGFYCDLESIGDFCKQNGLLFCVDAIQSLGVVPLDVKRSGIHFLAAGGQKWLLGPMGCGGLFVDREVVGLLDPVVVGWRSVTREEDFFDIHFELKPGAARFEPGTPNVVGIYALGAAIKLLLEVGIGAIHERVTELVGLLAEGLRERDLQIATPLNPRERAGIITFLPKGDPKALISHFMKNGVVVSERNNLIRVSPHFYNNEEDLDRFFSVLDSFSTA